jgi:N utilization substance protein B
MVMRTRRSARRIALDVLYEAEIRAKRPLEVLEDLLVDGWMGAAHDDDEPGEVTVTQEAVEYARTLVAGVQQHQAEIDALIVGHADRWALQRMPVVDRNLLRIALLELLWGEDVPVAVAINEAVELAKALSTDDSGRFINGLLGRIAAERR